MTWRTYFTKLWISILFGTYYFETSSTLMRPSIYFHQIRNLIIFLLPGFNFKHNGAIPRINKYVIFELRPTNDLKIIKRLCTHSLTPSDGHRFIFCQIRKWITYLLPGFNSKHDNAIPTTNKCLVFELCPTNDMRIVERMCV